MPLVIAMRIGYFGKEGSNTQNAAISMFGNSHEYESFQSINKIFAAIELDLIEQGVVPIENSVEGTVGVTNDLLYRNSLFITGESYQKITHCLIAAPGTRLDDLKYVISHTQALGQCSEFISEHDLEEISFSDTASAVAALSSEEYAGYCAIATKEAARIYRMEVLVEDIGDFRDNYTRFVSVSRTPGEPHGERTKVSVVVSVNHESGALKEVLEIYHRHDLNLTRIESRPVKFAPWRYIFFLDSTGKEGDQEALNELEKKCLDYKFLGRYASSFPRPDMT